MTTVYCNLYNCEYNFENECQRTSIIIEKSGAFGASCECAEIKSPAGATTPSKALENNSY